MSEKLKFLKNGALPGTNKMARGTVQPWRKMQQLFKFVILLGGGGEGGGMNAA